MRMPIARHDQSHQQSEVESKQNSAAPVNIGDSLTVVGAFALKTTSMFYDSCFGNKKLRHSQAKIISHVNLILVIRFIYLMLKITQLLKRNQMWRFLESLLCSKRCQLSSLFQKQFLSDLKFHKNNFLGDLKFHFDYTLWINLTTCL